MYLIEICLSLYLHLDTVDDVVGDSAGAYYVLDDGSNANESLYVLIRPAPDTFVQILEVIRCEARVTGEVQDLDGARSSHECTHFVDDLIAETRA